MEENWYFVSFKAFQNGKITFGIDDINFYQSFASY